MSQERRRAGGTIGTSEAATILGVDRSTVTRWVEKGDLTPIDTLPFTGAFLFSRSEVMRLAKQRERLRESA